MKEKETTTGKGKPKRKENNKPKSKEKQHKGDESKTKTIKEYNSSAPQDRLREWTRKQSPKIPPGNDGRMKNATGTTASSNQTRSSVESLTTTASTLSTASSVSSIGELDDTVIEVSLDGEQTDDCNQMCVRYKDLLDETIAASVRDREHESEGYNKLLELYSTLEKAKKAADEEINEKDKVIATQRTAIDKSCIPNIRDVFPRETRTKALEPSQKEKPAAQKTSRRTNVNTQVVRVSTRT